MAIGRSYEEALMKAVRSLDIDKDFGYTGKYSRWTDEDIINLLKAPTDDRLFAIYEALSRGMSVETISELTAIDTYFIDRIQNIIAIEGEVKQE